MGNVRAMKRGSLWPSREVDPRKLLNRGLDGCFRTAQAKEYPSALCRSLVVATLRGLQHRISVEGTGVPFSPAPPLAKWLQHMKCQSQVLCQTFKVLEAEFIFFAVPREETPRGGME